MFLFCSCLCFCMFAENIINNKGTEMCMAIAENTYHIHTVREKKRCTSSLQNARYVMCCTCPSEIHAQASPKNILHWKRHILYAMHSIISITWVIRYELCVGFAEKKAKIVQFALLFMNNGQQTNMQNTNFGLFIRANRTVRRVRTKKFAVRKKKRWIYNGKMPSKKIRANK